ncbi:hypothetical protein BU26DRAFT_34424 [Trematosphaeria pertusa]|uniref:Required for respiratory growth protein 9, mitochondrial n=1 Tax=Trematosphaeria pertusa TaxID=390896 RepID=A0A6A6J3V7_9PLEO|nr:uncharacterized protein BU26DRAFT_34424 [Trematosphaeria pertusa]KAF2257037.1 hypothetical protein BU26DRAFT_34424 [Trematosphaeria pertusa]
MNCHTCSRRALHQCIRSFTDTELSAFTRAGAFQSPQQTRYFSGAHRPQLPQRARAEPPKPFATNLRQTDKPVESKKDIPLWLVEKEAVKQKLGGAAWNPRKKLSPDTMEGIRHLHETQPDRFTTPILAQHFQVSPEAIRRILKSKWRPSDEEQEERLKRWDKRGEKIWSNLVELGIKPPKKWREMGVGRAERGEKPKWKSKTRNTVDVRDSFSEDILPIVDSSGESRHPRWEDKPLTERLGI